MTAIRDNRPHFTTLAKNITPALLGKIAEVRDDEDRPWGGKLTGYTNRLAPDGEAVMTFVEIDGVSHRVPFGAIVKVISRVTA